MKKKLAKSSNLPKSLKPYSMEERKDYINRFTSHPSMIDLFPDLKQRTQIASDEFEAKWWEACATVTRLDGSRFFIE